MSHLRVCLLFLGVIAAGFAGSSSSEIDCSKEVAPGSEKPKLSMLEKSLKAPGDAWDWLWGNKKYSLPTSLSVSEAVDLSKELGFIPPGMKWCGDGNSAKNSQELGYWDETDYCCRDHDNCQNNILTGEKLLNLHNSGMFTKSAYYCDTAFYKCLKSVKGRMERIIAGRIGNMYFNNLKPQSFKCVCPTPDCVQNDGTECKGKCTKYQWCDAPKF